MVNTTSQFLFKLTTAQHRSLIKVKLVFRDIIMHMYYVIIDNL